MTRKGTKADFIAWLRSKRPRQVVGVRFGYFLTKTRRPMAAYCPLGRYAVERDVPDPDFPDWAALFMEAVDKQPVKHITAQRALRLLGEVDERLRLLGEVDERHK